MFNKPVFGDAIQEIRKIIENNSFDEGEGSEARYNIRNEYVDMVLNKITVERPLKVVMD